MKIAIAQVNSTIGDFGGNTAKMIAARNATLIFVTEA